VNDYKIILFLFYACLNAVNGGEEDVKNCIDLVVRWYVIYVNIFW